MLLMLATLACTKGEDSGDSDSAAPCEDNVWGADADADGYGSASFTLTGCEQPVGYVDNTDDCDDTNSDYYPGAMVWLDDDGDGYGAAEQVASDCEGFVDNGDDCDDGDAEVNPDADEVCDDGIDNDCSGDAPECGLSGEVLLGSAWAVISGDAGDQLGGPVRGVGDWNSDGRDDFAVSARGDDTAGDGAGAVLIYTSGGAMDLGKADAKTTWTGAGASSGIFGVWPVGGDITGDGKDEIGRASCRERV